MNVTCNKYACVCVYVLRYVNDYTVNYISAHLNNLTSVLLFIILLFIALLILIILV